MPLQNQHGDFAFFFVQRVLTWEGTPVGHRVAHGIAPGTSMGMKTRKQAMTRPADVPHANCGKCVAGFQPLKILQAVVRIFTFL
jgi:hypothetical protein